MADTMMAITDIVTETGRLQAHLTTAKASDDPQIVHAAIIAAMEGLLSCVRALASEIVQVEIEGLDEPLSDRTA